MTFTIIQKDITTLSVDAIVNPTDQNYSGRGGVDKQIHMLCGKPLVEETKKLHKLNLGEAKATSAFNLSSKYIIHTSAPHWTGKNPLESVLLGSCYRNSLSLAHSLGCKSIAFPLIASKGKHFPRELAFSTAISTIKECLNDYPSLCVTLTLFGGSEQISTDLLKIVTQSINNSFIPDEKYEEDLIYETSDILSIDALPEESTSTSNVSDLIERSSCLDENLIENLLKKPTQANLDKIPIDESFASMLSRIMKERKLSNAAIYDELGMSSVGFWKLLTGETNPKKMTVFAIAVALNLSLSETKEMLMKAGYAINPSSIQDIVISGLIQNHIYDRYQIDNLLYSLDLQLLPGAIID